MLFSFYFLNEKIRSMSVLRRKRWESARDKNNMKVNLSEREMCWIK